MPRALVVVTVLVLLLGVWLVKGQGDDFARFGAQRERKLEERREVSGPQRATVALAGRVVDPAGRPLAGLLIALAPAGTSASRSAFEAEAVTTSDDRGRFRFALETAAPRLLRIAGPGIEPRLFADLRPSVPLEIVLESP